MRNDFHAHVAGRWMPSNPEAVAAFFRKLQSRIDAKALRTIEAGVEPQYRHRSIKKFADLIDSDPIVRMYLTQMIDQVPGYYKDSHPPESFYLPSIEKMLELLDDILDTIPEFNATDLVGFPINLILDWTMSMPAGFDLFRLDKVNAVFRDILNEWCEFLSQLDPNLDEYGWTSDEAEKQLNMKQYIYDPNDKRNWGFQSWNDFFTRRLSELGKKEHPVGEGIVSSCDSQVYAIKENVKLQDWFWVKSQPYSLRDMLTDDDAKPDEDHVGKYVEPFIGGTVFQAFLSAVKYHWWHSPVTGKILRAYVKQGTYYSEAESEGMDPAGPNDSQGYITHVATRAIIFIEAEDPAIGLICMMAVGMAEVSSCVITIEPGAFIKKGDELGYFQYGGSTYCLIFQPGVIEEFKVKVGEEIKMGQQIAAA